MNQRFVGIRVLEVDDLGGAVDVGVPRGRLWGERRDHVPVFDQLALAIGIENVGGDPLRCATVERLEDVQEHVGAVDPSSDDFDLALRRSFEELVEERDEALRTIGHAGRVLSVSGSCVLLECAAAVPITDALQVQAFGVRESNVVKGAHALSRHAG